MFDLTFGSAVAGWLPVNLCLNGRSWGFKASDVGPDPIPRLVAVAGMLHAGGDFFSYDIILYGEPAGMTIRISKEGGLAAVRLYYITDADEATEGDVGECLAETTVLASDLCHKVYCAVRSMLVVHGLAYLAKDWQEFPLGDFIAIHQSLDLEPKVEGQGLESEARWLQLIGHAEPGVGADSR